MNLEYRYQLVRGKKVPSREAADPTMLIFKDKYLLFCSMSGGFWYSDDLVNWNFKETPELPIHDYAPDVCVINGKVVFSASRMKEKCTFFESADPLQEPFHPIASPFSWHDPNLFQDEDGKVYFYWGCSAKNPLYGIEINPRTLQPVGRKVELLGGKPEIHGWERPGEHNIVPERRGLAGLAFRLLAGSGPFIEGAYMNKYRGKYYLQYSAPGTEYNIYGDGVYVSDRPLGPFVYQQHNPFSSVPGGFMNGAGHGSTFKDKRGNWWHVSTMRISINETFERRIGLFPCSFDKEGILHCNQELADYPIDVESGKKVGWMLLNGIPDASSCAKEHPVELGCDENVRTWWAASTKSKQEWYQIDLTEIKQVCAIQINFADWDGIAPKMKKKEYEKVAIMRRRIVRQTQSTCYLLEGSKDGKTWKIIKDATDGSQDLPHDFICMDEPEQLRFVRVSQMKMPFLGTPAISGLRVFGIGNGGRPERVERIQIENRDGLDLYLTWKGSRGAARYNVRYGIAENKLYGSWQTVKNELNFSFVNCGNTYYFAVDAINENGITEGKTECVRA